MDLQNYLTQISNADNANQLEAIRILLLGKNGIITNMIKELGNASLEMRKTKGKELNELKEQIAACITARKEEIEAVAAPDTYDYSLAFNKVTMHESISKNIVLGKQHLIPKTIERIQEIFLASGFSFVDGPDIESTYYNFEALNIPAEHPARDNNDTFYMHEDGKLLRTHTTSVQIRLLESMQNDPHDVRSVSYTHLTLPTTPYV